MIAKNGFKLCYYFFEYFGFVCSTAKPWTVLYTAFHWFIINCFGICSFLEIFWGSGVFNEVVEALSGVAIYTMTITTLSICFFREKDITSLLNRLETLRIELINDLENISLVNTASKVVAKLMLSTTSFLLMCPILSFFSSTFTDYQSNFMTKTFFIKIWIPWSIENFWAYLVAKIIITLMVESALLANLVFAMIHFTFAFQMSTYLKILQRYLETKGPSDKTIYRHHITMIQLIRDYKDIFSGQMYLETLVAPMMPCGYGVTLIRSIRRNEAYNWETIQKICATMMPPFIVCSCVQMVSTQIEKLHEASYMSKWYNESPKVRQDLLVLMIKTAVPTTINYRLLCNLDHLWLASVLQSIYSFLMLVINFDTN